MKLKQNVSNAEIAKMFKIDTRSVPRLIDLYINETEEKKKKIMDKLKRKLKQKDEEVKLVQATLE